MKIQSTRYKKKRNLVFSKALKYTQFNQVASFLETYPKEKIKNPNSEFEKLDITYMSASVKCMVQTYDEILYFLNSKTPLI